MTQHDAHTLLARLTEKHGINLDELSPPARQLLVELSEGYLDENRLVTSLLPCNDEPRLRATTLENLNPFAGLSSHLK